MSRVQEVIDATVADEIYRTEKGNGYDLVAKNLGLVDGSTVDVFLYSHDNFTVKMIGVYEDFEDKKIESESWMDILQEDFSNVGRKLRGVENVTDNYKIDFEIDGDYHFASRLSEQEKENINTSLADVIDFYLLDDSYEAIDEKDIIERQEYRNVRSADMSPALKYEDEEVCR